MKTPLPCHKKPYEGWNAGKSKCKSFALLLAGAFLSIAVLSACSSGGPPAPAEYPATSQVPVPAPYPLNTQMKMQALHHWDLLARDVAAHIADKIREQSRTTPFSVYIVPGASTPFEKAFRELLTTRIVQSGIRVAPSPEEQLLLSTDVQMVWHSRRIRRTPPGVLHALSPGLYVSRALPISGSSRAAASHAVGEAGLLAEAGRYTWELPRHEILINISLTLGNEYLARDSAIYYIDDPEWWHYRHFTGEQPRTSLVTYRVVEK